MYKTLVPFVIVLVITLSANNAKADTVVLQGAVTFSGFLGSFDLSFSGRNSDGTTFGVGGFGRTISGLSYPRPTDARGGTQINLGASAFLIGSDFASGLITINGVSYPPNVVDLNLQSTFVTVPFTTVSTLLLSAPCTVSGGLSGQVPPPGPPASVGFSGPCGATITLTRVGTDAQGFGRYNFRSISYGFPTAPPIPSPSPDLPEPTALVLLVTGLAAIAVKVKRRF